MSKIEIKRWDHASHGTLSEETVRRAHSPPNEHRVSQYQYKPGEVIDGIRAKAGLLYVAAGECCIEHSGERIHLRIGDVARLPDGTYSIEALGSESLSLIKVWKLPFAVGS